MVPQFCFGFVHLSKTRSHATPAGGGGGGGGGGGALALKKLSFYKVFGALGLKQLSFL